MVCNRCAMVCNGCAMVCNGCAMVCKDLSKWMSNTSRIVTEYYSVLCNLYKSLYFLVILFSHSQKKKTWRNQIRKNSWEWWQIQMRTGKLDKDPRHGLWPENMDFDPKIWSFSRQFGYCTGNTEIEPRTWKMNRKREKWTWKVNIHFLERQKNIEKIGKNSEST